MGASLHSEISGGEMKRVLKIGNNNQREKEGSVSIKKHDKCYLFLLASRVSDPV